ncbi:type IV pilus biogenesis/stability protein PilW [Planctomycetota bacterium]
MRQVVVFTMVTLAVALTSPADAVTWSRTEETCPLCETKGTFWTWASFGSYVSERESKYDMVFFPWDDEAWFWMCRTCGYAQTGGEFSDLTEKQVAHLREALAVTVGPTVDQKGKEKVSFIESLRHIPPEDSIPLETRLEQTVRVNELLERDEAFWKHFNRALIYHYRKINPDKARQYAKSEVLLLEDVTFPDKKTLYLLGEYHRMLGHKEEASGYFGRALEKSASFERDVMLVVLCCLLSAAVGGLWGWRRKRFVIPLCVTVVALVLMLKVFQLHQRANVNLVGNEYYNEIITERFYLLADQGQPKSVAPAAQESEGTTVESDAVVNSNETRNSTEQTKHETPNH